MSLPNIAETNLARLSANPYPGRGIVLGLDEAGTHWVQVYWVMGRSPNSRNRVLVVEGAEVSTAPHDPSKVEDPTNIIYRAMSSFRSWHVVTNGDHTDDIVQHVAAGSTFETALEGRRHETDAPNYTPRIAGLVRLNGEDTELKLAKIARDPGNAKHSIHSFYRYAGFINGFGACIHTYEGDGDPLPPFAGEPYPVPLTGGIDEIADAYWDALDTTNKVALAVKTIDCDAGTAAVTVRNKLS